MPTREELEHEHACTDAVWDQPVSRRGKYGNVLARIVVRGIRGITLDVSFDWPVVAIAGVNGTGKTTLIQLCSAAYVKPRGGQRPYKIGEWVRNALAGDTPVVQDDSSVTFYYAGSTPVGILYLRERTRWGYPRRNNPARDVRFVGIADFAPGVEKRDRLHLFQSRLAVRSNQTFTADQIASISRILGSPYAAAGMNTVGVADRDWHARLPFLGRGGNIYSEPHMGAGEQKVLRLVELLETAPERSTILLEEPELTLHPDAQRGLAWYLMNVSRRRGHQILMTTHSSHLFEALPPRARLLLVRRPDGLQCMGQPDSISAARELAGVSMSNRDLILVEDDVAVEFLREVLRRHNRQLLRNSAIVAIGDKTSLRHSVIAFRQGGVRAVGVRDADVGTDPAAGLFSLPGNLAPEELLLSAQNLSDAEPLLNGLQLAARQIGPEISALKLPPAKAAKRAMARLATALEIQQPLLVDRLLAAWAERNSLECAKLAAAIEASLVRTQL